MRTPSSRGCFFAAIALLIVTGCGGVDDGRVSISGSVTLDGKPLDGGMIAFIGGGGGALATASTNKEGKFQMQVALGTNASNGLNDLKSSSRYYLLVFKPICATINSKASSG